ncbi:hypothetical protein Leryth_006606 [Lithospermum erythrorhizon]|nr:hypothetical protein Leryth_006606 [Lithospermum erythrorhizon]
MRQPGYRKILPQTSSQLLSRTVVLVFGDQRDCESGVDGYKCLGKAITNLVLSGLPKVSQKGFWVMGNAEGLQSLISLEITSCRGVTDRSLEAVGKGCSNLKQLRLHKCCFGSLKHSFECFVKLYFEVEITLDRCMGIKDLPSESQYLSPCESLRSLSIKSCPGFGSSSLAMVGKLHSAHQFRSPAGLVTDAGLVSLANNCPMLNDLDMSRCSISDSGVAALSRGVQENLKVLSISGNHVLVMPVSLYSLDQRWLCSHGSQSAVYKHCLGCPLGVLLAYYRFGLPLGFGVPFMGFVMAAFGHWLPYNLGKIVLQSVLFFSDLEVYFEVP